MLLCITYILNAVFSIAGIGTALSELIGKIASEILIIILLWKFVNNKEDFKFLFRWISVIIFISCIYGFYEQITKSNPIVEWEKTFNHDETKIINWIYYNDDRGWRTQSIFEHAIGAGMIWASYIILIVLLYFKYNFAIKNNLFYFITAVLCIPNLIFVRSRTPLIFCIIGLFSAIGYRKKRTLLLSTLGALAILFAISITFCLNSDIFGSLETTYTGGSSLELRIDQFNHALNLFNQSPLYGLGFKYSSVINNADVQGLLGVEGVLLEIFPTYGLIGIVSYFFYFVFMCFIIPKKYHSYEIMFISLAYWIAIFVSSIPGFKVYILWVILFFIIRNPTISKKSIKMNNNTFIKYSCNYE